MKIRYLGTGAAEGIPALFCNCRFCREAKKRGEIRSRTQVIFGGELSVDFPPDAFYHAAKFGEDFTALRYLIVTHAHMDHFYGSDFVLRGYKYGRELKEPELSVFGGEETCEIFCESTRRELRPEVGEHIHLYVLSAFEEAKFGDWRVFPLMARHSSKEPLVFLIERGDKRILHLCDTGLLPEEDYEYLARLGGAPADLVTLDCTFLFGDRDKPGENARHMGLRENAEVLRRLGEIGLVDGHTKKVITHFSHNAEPTAERLKEAERAYGVIAAYDGMTVEI